MRDFVQDFERLWVVEENLRWIFPWRALTWHRFVTTGLRISRPNRKNRCNEAVPGHRTPRRFVFSTALY